MFTIPCITIDEKNISTFSEINFTTNERSDMWLTEQIGAKNFRLRKSEPGYTTDWHVINDPTLIIIQNGILRISLQNGEYKDFKAGEMFIAADNLPEGTNFNTSIHGHKAAVIGNETLIAAHIKLNEIAL